MHKLSDGGIPRLASAIWHKIIRKEDVPAPQLVRGQLGLTLVKQGEYRQGFLSARSIRATAIDSILNVFATPGFHYYVMLEVVRIIFLALYYGAPEVEYQVMGSALLCAVEPVLAGAIFRNASVRRQRQSGVMWRGRYEGSNSNDTGTPPVTPTTPRRLGIPGTPGGANIMGGGQSDGVLVTRISRVSMSNDANGGDVSGDESDEHQGGGGHGPSNSKAARQWRAVQQRNAAALKVESPNANPSLTHSYHHRKRDSRATARASTGLGFTRSFDAATDLSTPKAARFQGLFSPSLNHRSSDIELGTPTTLVDGEESRFGSPKMPLSPAPSETPYFYLRRESPRTPPNEVADNHDVVQRLSSSYPSLGSRASASSGHLALNESQLWTTNEEERRSESRATADTNGSGKDTVRDFRFVN